MSTFGNMSASADSFPSISREANGGTDSFSPRIVASSSFVASFVSPPRGPALYIVDPRRTAHKYVTHILVCLFIPGPYFMDSMMGALKTQICAPDGLHISSTKFSLLFALPSAVGVLCGPIGMAIQRVGDARSAFVAGAVVLCSSVLVAASMAHKMFWMVMLGRVLFWGCLYSLCSLQTMIVYKLFSGPELTIASGFIIFACRLGGMSGYFMSGVLLHWFEDDVVATMWLTVGFVGVALAATSVFACLRGGTATVRAVLPQLNAGLSSRQVSPPNFREQVHAFSVWTWLVICLIAILYSAVFPFETIAADYFESDWDMGATEAGFNVSLAAAFGLIAWSFGLCIRSLRAQLLVSCVAWMFFVGAFSLLMVQVPSSPTLQMCMIGVSYAYSSTCTWILIPLTLRSNEAKTAAVSLAYATMAFSMVCSNIIVGILHDCCGYRAVCAWFAFLSITGFLFASILLCTMPNGGVNIQGMAENAHRAAGSEEEMAGHVEIVRLIVSDPNPWISVSEGYFQSSHSDNVRSPREFGCHLQLAS